LVSQIVSILETQPGVPMIENTFDTFLDLPLLQDHITERTFDIDHRCWPIHIQPLVHWVLDYVISHSGITGSHSSIDIFATKLMEREGFLAFICSSFLITTRWVRLGKFARESHDVVLSDESFVLGRLAETHRDQPSAADVWYKFLSWAKHYCNQIQKEASHELWTRSDFVKHGHMADHHPTARC
jgi:hypothetical protein